MHTIESLLASIISRKAGGEISVKNPGDHDQSVHSPTGSPATEHSRQVRKANLRKMTASQINKTKDKNREESRKINDELIESGRGSEKFTESVTKTDSLAIRRIENSEESEDIQDEISARYGPGAPSHLPTGRGFGPRDKSMAESVVNEVLETFKAGARHSSGDKKNLQAIHDASVDLGASCPMLVFKQDNGKYRWLTFSSTAFQDRDREIISTKAQEDDCNYLNKTGDYGPLRWWHVGKPVQTNSKDWRSWSAGVGLDIGRCDFSAMHGRVRIESGTFYDERVGARMKEISNNLSVSIGYSHLSDEPKGGIFEHSHTFERSFLPLGRQSNYFASIPVIQKESTMDNEKLTKFRELMGPLAELVLGKAEATEKAAESTGLSFKEKVGSMTEEEFKEFLQEAVTKAANPFAKPDPDEPDDDEEMTEEEKKIAADKKKKKDGEMTKKETDLTTALSAIQTALQTTQKDARRIDLALKQAQENDVKIAQAMQQMNEAQKKSEKAIKSLLGDLSKSVAKGYRASQDDETTTDETKAKEAGPGQKDSAFSNFLDFAISGSSNGNQPPAG